MGIHCSDGAIGFRLTIWPYALVGSSLWRLTHRKKVAQIDARERELYQHIVRNRVDPSRQSATVSLPYV